MLGSSSALHNRQLLKKGSAPWVSEIPINKSCKLDWLKHNSIYLSQWTQNLCQTIFHQPNSVNSKLVSNNLPKRLVAHEQNTDILTTYHDVCSTQVIYFKKCTFLLFIAYNLLGDLRPLSLSGWQPKFQLSGWWYKGLVIRLFEKDSALHTQVWTHRRPSVSEVDSIFSICILGRISESALPPLYNVHYISFCTLKSILHFARAERRPLFWTFWTQFLLRNAI
jgi:hypothetical protein